MRVRTKLVAIIVVVAVVPLTVSAITTLSVHQRAFDDKVGELHARSAEYGAALSETYLSNARSNLMGLVTKSIDWAALDERERSYALSLAYTQLSDISVVSLVDESGQGLGASVYMTPNSVDPQYADHPPMSAESLDAFGRGIPFDEAKRDGVAVGEPLWAPGARFAIVPLAFAVRAPAVSERWVLAVGVSLRGVCAQLDSARSPGTRVYLIDAAGRILCGGSADRATVDSRLVEHLPTTGRLQYRDSDDEVQVAAIAALVDDWFVVVEQSSSSAFAASRELRTRVIVWIVLGVVAAMAAGLFLAHGITRPIRTLADGARALERGDFDHELSVQGRDEFADLSRAFNAMAAEIRVWNAELHDRVDERTRELNDAQEQLLESRKLAAVASLGAGVAHEINNPLTAVLSLTQILKVRAEKDGMSDKQVKILARIEEGALRIHDIVKTMHGLSQSYGEGYMNHRPAEIVSGALDAASAELDEAGIAVVRDFDDDVPQIFGNGNQLREALERLIDNSIKAMHTERRELRVSLSSIEGQLVRIVIADTGRGIDADIVAKVFEPFFTTKDDWQSRGLGLSIVHRIITAHHGTIRVEKGVEIGATLVITLPAAPKRSHLV